MKNFETVDFQRHDDGSATLWLNRPEKNNAFNAQMIAELNDALRHIALDENLRFLILRGRGKHFCAGADLAWMKASATFGYSENLEDAKQLGELMHLLHTLPCPTMAVVQGAAYGGALGLVACCDFAIGAGDAIFSLSEVRIGLAPAVISPYVVRALGERASRRYALSADRFDGVAAEHLGLLAQTYAPELLDEGVAQWVAKLLLNSPQAMRETKALLMEVGGGRLSLTLRQHTEKVIAEIRCSAEGQEGLTAFLEKRKPGWQ